MRKPYVADGEMIVRWDVLTHVCKVNHEGGYGIQLHYGATETVLQYYRDRDERDAMFSQLRKAMTTRLKLEVENAIQGQGSSEAGSTGVSPEETRDRQTG